MVKKLKEQLQETVLVVAMFPPLHAGGGPGALCSRQEFNSGGKVVLAARNHLGGFWETLRPHEMVIKVPQAGPGPSVKCFGP